MTEQAVEKQGRSSTDQMLALCAWIGAILARLRAGEEPYPGAFRRHPRVAYSEDAGPGYEELCEEPRETDAPEPDADAESFCLARPYMIVDRPFSWECPRYPVFEQLLEELHERGRGEAWEDQVWSAVIWYSPLVLPERILLDLVGRGLPMCRCRCAHSDSPESVWFALADKWPEAVEGLAALRYRIPSRTWSDTEVILNDWSWDELLIQLTELEPSSVEKAEGLLRRIQTRNAESDPPIYNRVRSSTHPVFAELWQESLS